MTSTLSNIRVLDLTRVLAGPICTQILGDLGATIFKIERPGTGDDTRSFGPPYLPGTTTSSYFAAGNRNKKSIALDFKTPTGRALLLDLLAHCDILVENFKPGTLAKHRLDYATLHAQFPRLIYCSITGFGQTGPLSSEPGYDFIAQGMSGLMMATGAPDGPPTKTGVAIADYTTGLNAAIGILAALHARTQTGMGQQIDCALLDSSVALMTHVAQAYLTGGTLLPRVGNAHASIVPYQDFQTSDGHVIIAVGNDAQFGIFARTIGHPEWADDPHFATNTARLEHRAALLALIAPIIANDTTAHWVDRLRAVDIPVGPILRIDQTFADPQVQARGLIAPARDGTPLIGPAFKLSDTPPLSAPIPPPALGADTDAVLRDILNLSDDAIAAARSSGAIG